MTKVGDNKFSAVLHQDIGGLNVKMVAVQLVISFFAGNCARMDLSKRTSDPQHLAPKGVELDPVIEHLWRLELGVSNIQVEVRSGAGKDKVEVLAMFIRLDDRDEMRVGEMPDEFQVRLLRFESVLDVEPKLLPGKLVYIYWLLWEEYSAWVA